eukprot:360794-Lingulodinium_polyedra.AAC.1
MAARPKAKAKAKERAGAKAPKKIQFVIKERSQPEVQALAPPGAHAWGGNFGSWQGHLPPNKRVSFAWQKYGEPMAAKLVLQALWRQYLDMHHLPDSACWVADLLDG